MPWVGSVMPLLLLGADWLEVGGELDIVGDIEVAFRFGVSVVPLDEAVALGWFGHDAGFLTEVVAACTGDCAAACRTDGGRDIEVAVFAEDGLQGLVGAHRDVAWVAVQVVGPAVEDVALGRGGLDADDICNR